MLCWKLNSWVIEEAEKPTRGNECLGLSFQEARTKFKCKKFIGKYKEYGSMRASAIERESKAAITEHYVFWVLLS